MTSKLRMVPMMPSMARMLSSLLSLSWVPFSSSLWRVLTIFPGKVCTLRLKPIWSQQIRAGERSTVNLLAFLSFFFFFFPGICFAGLCFQQLLQNVNGFHSCLCRYSFIVLRTAAKPHSSAVKWRHGVQIEHKHQRAASAELHVCHHLQNPPFLDKLSLQ